MIQTYSTLQKQISSFSELIDENTYIQKIYSSSFFVCLNLRKPGQSLFLYLGRGKSYEGMWKGEKNIPSKLRKRDRFLEYLRKYLSSCKLLSIEIDDQDRIIKLSYQKWGKRNSLYLFYKGRELFFMHDYFVEDKAHLTKSWGPSSVEKVSFDTFNELGRRKLSTEKLQNIIEVEQLLDEEEKLAFKNKKGSKQKKFIKRKISKIEQDLEKVKARDELEVATAGEDLNLLSREVKFGVHRVKFKEKEHFKRRDEIFTKIKKLKKAEKILEQRLMEAQEKNNSTIEESFVNELKTNEPVWNNLKVKEIKEKKLDSYKEMVVLGKKLAVGLSAQGNDEIRKNFGKKDDYWFHLDGEVSAHIIAKVTLSELTPEFLSEMGRLLLNEGGHSKTEGDLIYTQLKNIKSIKGKAGLVKFTKEKRFRFVKNNIN